MLSQKNPFHNLLSQLFYIRFNIILLSMSTFSKVIVPWSIFTKMLLL
jgi:hypothetical protein